MHVPALACQTRGTEPGHDEIILDVQGQVPRVNRLYTQLTLGFPLSGDDSAGDQKATIAALQQALHVLATAFPWLTGHVICRRGIYAINCDAEYADISFTVNELTTDPNFPTWDDLTSLDFPYSVLHESVIAPCNTLIPAAIENPPVFMVQANFVRCGLLLTFNAQHGAMDMAAFGQVLYLLSKATRNESFTSQELDVCNRQLPDLVTRQAIPEEQDGIHDPEAKDQETSRDDSKSTQAGDDIAHLQWVYVAFSSVYLTELKSRASAQIPSMQWISTDDVLSAHIWQLLTRTRFNKDPSTSEQATTLSRNVDMRAILSLPQIYPGFATESTRHTFLSSELANRPLGLLALTLRNALQPDALRQQYHQHAQSIATNIRQPTTSLASTTNTTKQPQFELRLSSWAKEKVPDLPFTLPGLATPTTKPTSVRRPAFDTGAREGLVYLLPRSPDGEIVAGLCLQSDHIALFREQIGLAAVDSAARPACRFIG
jgi:trichothecene 3-O-acetyltransferase